MTQFLKALLLSVLFSAIFNKTAYSHAIIYDDPGVMRNTWDFIFMGINHIVPNGFDHLLFLIGLFLSCRDLKRIFLLASAFTVAHTITLILTATGHLPKNELIIEPIIGLTIAVIGIENLLGSNKSKLSYLVVFIFGLIHGCGFANALAETGIPEQYFFSSLISFNLGIEVAQITVIFLLYFLSTLWKSEISYKRYIVKPVSIVIIIAGISLSVHQLYINLN